MTTNNPAIDLAEHRRPPRCRLMPPAVPLGPRPPRPAGFTAEMMAGTDKIQARTIRDIAERMACGYRAADVTGELARFYWNEASTREPSPFDVEMFRWLRELGETPHTPEGVVTLLRLANYTERQLFDLAGI